MSNNNNKKFTSEMLKAIYELVDDFNKKHNTEYEVVGDFEFETSFSVIDTTKEEDNIVATFGW